MKVIFSSILPLFSLSSLIHTTLSSSSFTHHPLRIISHLIKSEFSLFLISMLTRGLVLYAALCKIIFRKQILGPIERALRVLKSTGVFEEDSKVGWISWETAWTANKSRSLSPENTWSCVVSSTASKSKRAMKLVIAGALRLAEFNESEHLSTFPLSS